MREIITSVKGLTLEGICVKHVTATTRKTYEWVKERQKQLLADATLPERLAAKSLSKCEDQPLRQAYFEIRGRSYFTDFFFPSRLLVVEIDGSVHKTKKAHDRQRDADFRSIGIRTIRISNKAVMIGKTLQVLASKLYR